MCVTDLQKVCGKFLCPEYCGGAKLAELNAAFHLLILLGLFVCQLGTCRFIINLGSVSVIVANQS